MPGKTTVDANGVTTIEQGVYPIHNIPMKDLLNAIPCVQPCQQSCLHTINLASV